MANKWTTEYPTQPGYYWVRNRICRVDDKWQKYEEPLPLHVVEIVSDGELYDTGSEVGRDRSDIVSAEWFGPIQQPQEPSECMVGGHPPGCQGHIQPPQENDK